MSNTANDYVIDGTGSYTYKYCHKCHWWYTDEECPQCKRKENACSKVYNEGWVCPKCGNVYAPHVTECLECNRNVSPWTITWTGRDWDYPKYS